MWCRAACSISDALARGELSVDLLGERGIGDGKGAILGQCQRHDVVVDELAHLVAISRPSSTLTPSVELLCRA